MATSSSWAKLMVSGSSAEQPSPASPKASTASAVSPCESDAMSRKATPRTTGSTWKARWVGNQRWMDARATRPTVTIVQNTVRAMAATVVEAPTSVVMSICDQLPFIVSQMP